MGDPAVAVPAGFRTPGRRVAELAADRGRDVAVVEVAPDGSDRATTWADLHARVGLTAAALHGRGLRRGGRAAVVLPNGLDHLVTTLAVWHVGATPVALDPRSPEAERAALLELADAAVTVDAPLLGEVDDAAAPTGAGDDRLAPSDDPVVPARIVPSGGSTGRPKLIALDVPAGAVPGELGIFGAAGMRPDQVQLVVGPLHHNLASAWAHAGLLQGHRLVVPERFDADVLLDAVARHRVAFAAVVPTHLLRLLRADQARPRDLSSIEALVHSGGACPTWLKQAWIDRLGPTRLHEGYGATEGLGATLIRGDEWLRRPGSVGRPVGCDVRVVDVDGRPVPPGVVGEVRMRPDGGVLRHRYLGAPPPAVDADGYGSVGDLGWLDADGWLHIADRRDDLIISGGVNVYPAEVEAVLLAHPGVADAAIVGMPDEEWGQRVHAVVQPAGDDLDVDALLDHCRSAVGGAKVPRSVEVVGSLPRDDAGKLRRSALRAARS